MGGEECEAIRAMRTLDARLTGWCRMAGEDLAACRGLALARVNLSIPSSRQQLARKLGKDEHWAFEQIRRWVPQARDMGFAVTIGMEDASRADTGFLQQIAEVAAQAGADRLRYADTLGLLDPFTTYERIAALRAATDLDLEMHAHDDLGLATANTLAAIRAGATHVNTTVMGLGERAGNAALEEIVLASKTLGGDAGGIRLNRLPALAQQVARAAGRSVSHQQPGVGAGVFRHEAGIHVDGLLKDPANYQVVDPAWLGRRHEWQLGKHSGSQSLMRFCAEHGLELDRDSARRILPQLRTYSSFYKHPPAFSEICEWLAETVQ
jgi:homocitrate synthase NifV